jgi:hypothetical protein
MERFPARSTSLRFDATFLNGRIGTYLFLSEHIASVLDTVRHYSWVQQRHYLTVMDAQVRCVEEVQKWETRLTCC